MAVVHKQPVLLMLERSVKQAFPDENRYSLARWRPVDVDDLIRLGRPEDGGYVISRRCVDTSNVLFSFGISEDWSFDKAFCHLNPQVMVVGVDGSISDKVFSSRARDCINKAMLAIVQFQARMAVTECRVAAYWWKKAVQFRRFYDGRSRRFHKLFLGANRDASAITWRDLWRIEPLLVTAKGDHPTCFVKMDIEGSEYEVLPALLLDTNKISGLTIEFHDCHIHWGRFSMVMDELCKCFVVVHVHGNNFKPLIPGSTTPQALEISFVNRRLLPDHLREVTAQYPRPDLDKPCNPEKPDYPIYF